MTYEHKRQIQVASSHAVRSRPTWEERFILEAEAKALAELAKEAEEAAAFAKGERHWGDLFTDGASGVTTPTL